MLIVELRLFFIFLIEVMGANGKCYVFCFRIVIMATKLAIVMRTIMPHPVKAGTFSGKGFEQGQLLVSSRAA